MKIKVELLLLFMASALHLCAANVVWSSASKLNEISGWNAYEYFVYIDGYAPTLFIAKSGSDYYYDHLGLDENRASVATLDDVVDSSYAFGEGGPTGKIDFGDSGAYLAYRIFTYDAMENIEYAYGWMHIYIGSDGLLYGESAFDLDGGAMYVGGGAVPEPTSGLLMLLGAMVIMLRRRSRPIRSHECSIHHADAPHVLSEKPVPSAG